MRFLPGLFCLLLVLPAVAEPANLAAAHAVAGNEIESNDGHLFHLAGIMQPYDNEYRQQAQKLLQDLISERQITFDDHVPDRYGRVSAQLYAVDSNGTKTWLQGEMLKRGLAFIYPPTGAEERLDEMISAETQARRAKTGIWADGLYADIPADKVYYKQGQFAFVSGTVTDAWRTKETVYIHFGENWRDTLTIAIAAHDLRKFRAAGIDPLGLAGKTVSTRGWVKHDIGPMITVTDPAQMQIVSR